ncbi:MAG: hypothetical protein F6K24_56030 [Okeania sp. SIO2D1]|nr:hypothetical protein [Okeania sp. SIO2D1]
MFNFRNSIPKLLLNSFRISFLATFLATSSLLLVQSFVKSAQAGSEPEIFENVTITPGQQPSTVTVRGISGGSVETKNKAGTQGTDTGACAGFVDELPDHIMTLTEFFNFLSVKVRSSGDTTLLVDGPGGTWCNDDSSGVDPAIAGQWLEGEYKIWVGSHEQDQYHPYVIQIKIAQ